MGLNKQEIPVGDEQLAGIEGKTKGRNPLACEISDDLEEVEKYLIEHGFDGLFCPGECACLARDLAPCGLGLDEKCECEAGYLTDGQKEGYDWMICRRADDSTETVRKRVLAKDDPHIYNEPEKPTKPLYKTTIIIWSEYDTCGTSVRCLGDNVADRDAYCSKLSCQAVQNPEQDPDWDGTEFFDEPDDWMEEE